MKRLLSVFLICITVLTMGACSSKDEDENSLLKAVLNGEKTFITEKGEAVFLKNYAVGHGKLATPLYANPTEFVFVDFDGDKIDELVINISTDYGAYLILRRDGLDVYGYEFGVRSLISLKTDGSFIGSNGASSNYYCRLTFEDNKANVVYTAIKDSNMNRFELDGKECSVEELNEYINDWELKESVKWINYKIYTENTSKEDSDNGKDVSNLEKINLNNYVSVTFEGDDSTGWGRVTFDKEKFLLDHINNVSFDEKNYVVYSELYGETNESAANTITKYIHTYLDKNGNLSNGDTVKIIWRINSEIIETYFELNYEYTSETYLVTGLK